MTLYNVFLEFILPDMVLHNLLMEVLDFRREWSKGFYNFLLYLFFLLIFLPINLVLFVLFCLPLPLALGIVFLLNILRTKPVTQQELDDSHKLIAAQIVLTLRQLRYRFTSFIARTSEKWLRTFLGIGNVRESF